jgi:hypothetical protein
MRYGNEKIKYQFYSFDPTWDCTHDLRHSRWEHQPLQQAYELENLDSDLNLQQQQKNRKQYSIMMKLQGVFNNNVGTNKQPYLHGNHSMVNINFWNISHLECRRS